MEEDLLHRYESYLQGLQDRFRDLQNSAQDDNPLIQELGSSLEELFVAQEELLSQQEEVLAAHRQLDVERRRYQSLFNLAPDAYLVTDPRGIVIDANQGAIQLLRVPMTALPGKPLMVYVASSDKKRFSRLLRTVEQGESIRDCELCLRPRRSPEVDVSANVQPDEDLEGSPVLRWSLRDITERKRAQREAEQRRRRIELLEEVTAAANQARAARDALEFAVERICAYTGWPVGHVYLRTDDPDPVLVPTNIWFLDEPGNYADFRRATEATRFAAGEGLAGRVLSSGEPLSVTDITRTPDSQRLSLLDAYDLHTGLFFPLWMGSRIAGVIEFFCEQDAPPDPELMNVLEQIGTQLGRVIEREQSRAALEASERQVRASERRFRTVFESAHLGIALISRDGAILSSNPYFEQMLGYTHAELAEVTLQELSHPEEAGKVQSRLDSLFGGARQSYTVESRYLHKSGSVVWMQMVVSIPEWEDQTAPFSIVMAQDITLQKNLEVELSEVQRRLLESAESERVALARELHDGPLQDLHGVIFHLAPLYREIEKGEVLEDLDEVKDMLTQVIASLRGISGELRPPTLEPFGLEKAIRDHVGTFQERNPGLHVHLDLFKDGPTIPHWIRLALFRIYQQAMMNIIRHAQAENVWINLEILDGRVALEVQDDGVGFQVPERAVELLREDHFGLVGSAERAQAIGGRLTVHSKPGEGTRIRVEAPMQTEQEPEEVRSRTSMLIFDGDLEPGSGDASTG